MPGIDKWERLQWRYFRYFTLSAFYIYPRSFSVSPQGLPFHLSSVIFPFFIPYLGGFEQPEICLPMASLWTRQSFCQRY